MPASGGGHAPETELDRLSNILKSFNDLFGNIAFTDRDRVTSRVTGQISTRVAADTAYQNAQRNSGEENARVEHGRALMRVMTSLLKDDAELFKQFMDNEQFRRGVSDTTWMLTYRPGPSTSA